MKKNDKAKEELRQALLKARTELAMMNADHHDIYQNKEEREEEIKADIKAAKRKFAEQRITAISEKRGKKDDKHKRR